MKKTGLILGMLASSFCAQAQEIDNTKIEEKPALTDRQKALAGINAEFSNLPKEQRLKYLELRQEAHRLFSKKRIFEALVMVYEMRDIFKKDPAVLNLLGAICVEIRDFNHAREVFTEAINLTGEDPKLLFNLAEIAFCANDWETCLKEMSYILKRLEEEEKKQKAEAIEKGLEPSKHSYLDSDFTKIMIFKQMLCHLALAEKDNVTAEQKKQHTAEAHKIAEMFDFMVDSPFYYYANAALKYSEDKRTEASIWLITARKVFSNNRAALASWDDTLVEFGYIESHYGKHYKEDSLLKKANETE